MLPGILSDFLNLKVSLFHRHLTVKTYAALGLLGMGGAGLAAYGCVQSYKRIRDAASTLKGKLMDRIFSRADENPIAEQCAKNAAQFVDNQAAIFGNKVQTKIEIQNGNGFTITQAGQRFFGNNSKNPGFSKGMAQAADASDLCYAVDQLLSFFKTKKIKIVRLDFRSLDGQTVNLAKFAEEFSRKAGQSASGERLMREFASYMSSKLRKGDDGLTVTRNAGVIDDHGKPACIAFNTVSSRYIPPKMRPEAIGDTGLPHAKYLKLLDVPVDTMSDRLDFGGNGEVHMAVGKKYPATPEAIDETLCGMIESVKEPELHAGQETTFSPGM